MATKYGTSSANTITGTSSADLIYGRGGDDKLYGLGGSDKLYGEGGNDKLYGGTGNDRLDGGSGIDTASYTDATGAFTVSLLTNTSSGNRGADTLVSIENLEGGAYNDVLTGNGGASTVCGTPTIQADRSCSRK